VAGPWIGFDTQAEEVQMRWFRENLLRILFWMAVLDLLFMELMIRT
jgi:hypothetical protein